MDKSRQPPKEVAKLRTLFKYCSNSPELITGLFERREIRFTQPYALNDPLEFNPAIRFQSKENDYRYYEYDGVIFPSNYLWNWLNLIESRINTFGILSLTENPFSYDMWSHYANGHKGFQIEFNVGSRSKPTLEMEKDTYLPIYRVRYVSTNAVNLDKMADKTGCIPERQFRDKIFLRKTKLWKYEKEYRAIRRLDTCETYKPPVSRTSYRDNSIYLFPMSLGSILSVSFGVNMPVEDKERIIDLCSGNNITFFQALIPKGGKNEIRPVPISHFGSLRNYLDMSPQLFTFDSIETAHASSPTIKVSSLSEIPYYALQKEDYDAYYEKRKAFSRENTQVLAATEEMGNAGARVLDANGGVKKLSGKSHETA